MHRNYIITLNGGFISEDELYHHGIKGMKWGARRFQNEDGSLTTAGKKRYGDESTHPRTKLYRKEILERS